jgi:putative metallohydrolase (TIGR04338 family)
MKVIKFQPGLIPVLKHQEHDQKTHGNWATGGELDSWNPLDPIPDSPKNAGGMTAKAWEAWEHGPDGQNFIALFRKYACQELGLEVPKTPFDQGGYLNYMMDRGWGKPTRDEAKGMLNAIANGRPQPALYRGMYESNDEQEQGNLDALLSTKPGDTFDMPLVSATRSLGVATWYAADMVGAGKRSVVMKIQEGAKGVALKKENSTYPQDYEVITSGKFEVVSINTVSTPYWSRSIFEPRKTTGDAQYPDYYEIATFDKTRFSPEYAKKAYEAVTSGNYKSLETPTFKLTPDRSGGALSSWTKQEGKEFTVIEVKMVEPHTVQKAKDFGNEFFFLFNNMPFIHDDLEDMQKHQEHDQSSHGNWATGTPQGGNGLAHREIYELQSGTSDSLVRKIYDAEERFQPNVQRDIPKPFPPSRTEFQTSAEYDKAYKAYSKAFDEWSRESTRNIKSTTGVRHLDGTKAGVQDYVNAVTSADWFIEAFGDGGVVGTPKVSLRAMGAAGQYSIGTKGGVGYSALAMDKGYSQAEPVILHELAHYATAISATSRYEGHGVEFAKNYIYMASKVISPEYAAGLEKAYREAGVPLG